MPLTLFCRHSPTITFLERELEWMRLQYAHERARAEVAVSELLRLKAGTSALHPLAVPHEREQGAVEKLLENPEFVSAGATE